MSIEDPEVDGNSIYYRYNVTGPWSEVFHKDRTFCIEYNVDMTDIPLGVAAVPMLANILPIAWVYDAKVVVSVCDADFLQGIPQIKQGYENMYPMIDFGGVVTAGRIEDNSDERHGAVCLFSGGVDAFNTLIQHVDESPTLLTIHGSDVSLGDAEGWTNVERHVKEVAADFSVDCVSVASSFRLFLDEGKLNRKVSISGDNWWHGFQHGLGILGHAAPVAWRLGKRTVYIASSFTAADKGKVTCASDPSIDNHVRFCGAQVVHDGYEFCRQDKVSNIVRFSRESGVSVSLHVCWESTGGLNCCRCEKCLRTILAIYAEGADPRNFGFDYGDFNELGKYYRRRYATLNTDEFLLLRYFPIQESMRKHYKSRDEVELGFRWFYDIDITKLVHASFLERVLAKVVRKVRSLVSK